MRLAGSRGGNEPLVVGTEPTKSCRMLSSQVSLEPMGALAGFELDCFPREPMGALAGFGSSAAS
jgi:hypothetical protein